MSDGMLKKYYQFELGQVCSRLSSGKGIAAKEISEHGVYPVFGGNGLRGYSDRKNFEGQCAIIGRQGAFCGNVRFFSGEAYMTEHAVVVCANEKSDIKYLSYLLGTLNLGRLSGQSAQPGLSVKTLSKQVIQLPDISKQRQIAKVLSAFDEKIELNTQINHNLEEQAKAIFDDMFPGITDGDSCVGDIITPKRGKSLLSKDAVPGDVPVIAGGLEPATFHNVSNTTPPVLTISASGANAGYVSLWTIPVWSSDSSFIDSSMTGNVYFWYVLLKKRQKEIFDAQTGSAQPHIYPQHIAQMSLANISKQDIEAFTNTVKPIFDTIGENKKQNKRLAQLRDTLLPKLMSGEIDVSEVEI